MEKKRGRNKKESGYESKGWKEPKGSLVQEEPAGMVPHGGVAGGRSHGGHGEGDTRGPPD